MIDLLEDISFYLLKDKEIEHDFFIKINTIKNPSWQFSSLYSLEMIIDISFAKIGLTPQLYHFGIKPHEKFNLYLYFDSYINWRKNLITLIIRQ